MRTHTRLLDGFLPRGTAVGQRERPPRESVAAVLLIVATVVALAWANLPGSSYDDVWRVRIGLGVGGTSWEMDLRHLINDGLMTFFFALITLEVRRELELGELRDARRAAVPVAAAAAGIVLPALIFLLVNGSGEAAVGWGTVVSTDTAFVLGLLALLGRGLPSAVRVFLVTLAVADDIGALAVIAIAYTDDLSITGLAVAGVGLAAIAVCRRVGVWRGAPYLVLSVLVWAATLGSGVHATLAGVAIALLLPVFDTRDDSIGDARRLVRAFAQSPSPAFARDAEEGLQRAVSVNDRAHRLLSPYVDLVVLPLFALANAGVRIDADILADAWRSPLTWGIVVALVVGKPVAVGATAFAVTRIAPGLLPRGVSLRHVGAIGLLSGVGFTLSLFIAELAFDDPHTLRLAHIGILTASLVATLTGGTVLLILGRLQRRRPTGDTLLPRAVDPDVDHVTGPDDAPVSLVEYGDLAADVDTARTGVLAELVEHFGDDLQYTFRHAPAAGTIGWDAALAAEAAALQGRFDPFRAALSSAATPITERDIRLAASRAGINIRLFDRDRTSASVAERVERDVEDAARSAARRAPSLFVGGALHSGPTDTGSLIGALERSAPHRLTTDGRVAWSAGSLEWTRADET